MLVFFEQGASDQKGRPREIVEAEGNHGTIIAHRELTSGESARCRSLKASLDSCKECPGMRSLSNAGELSVAERIAGVTARWTEAKAFR